jgi:hypothetical protein
MAIQNVLRPLYVLADTVKNGYSAENIAIAAKFQGGLALAAYELILAWSYIALLVFVAVLFFTKRRAFRAFYIFAWAYPVGAFTLDLLLSMYIFDQSFEQAMATVRDDAKLLSTIFVKGIPAILYLLLSRRVANTFIR